MNKENSEKNIDALINLKPFENHSEENDELFINSMKDSIEHQLKISPVFYKWLKSRSISLDKISQIDEFPFFPSSVFKHVEFGESSKITRIIRSSGTTSQLKSKIFIDSETSRRQTRTLTKILSSILGKSRRPFLILDVEPENKNHHKTISARIAGMSGYLMVAKTRNFIGIEKGDRVELDKRAILEFCEASQQSDRPPVLIGYTYMTYKLLIESGINLKDYLPEGTSLLHFGGWKKLVDRKIPKVEFNNRITNLTGIPLSQIFDVYGFTEQLGVIYPSVGNLPASTPIYSRVIVRDPDSLKIQKDGKSGLLQFLCPIPHSYPGQSLINDDLGFSDRSENCYSKKFWVQGRPSKAVARGCGDTMPEGFYL